MLTDEQITAIAREYAEEMCAHMEDDFIKDEAIKDNELTFQMAVNHLSQRYCLVEKSRVEDVHKSILVQLDPKSFGYSPYNQGRMDILKSLFPEIAKEVEE